MNRKNLLKTYRNYILVVICGILTIANVIITIGGATSGVSMSVLQKKESQLAEQNRDLQDELVKSLSVSSLQEKSSSLGFVKPENLVYLSQSAPVANIIP